jgi:hypothetical protein
MHVPIHTVYLYKYMYVMQYVSTTVHVVLVQCHHLSIHETHHSSPLLEYCSSSTS